MILSNYKYQYGCKGVGRFTWLKVFSNVHIHSECEGEKIDINFNLEFDDNNNEHWNVETSDETEKPSTKIDFQNCILGQNDYVDLDLEDIKQVIQRLQTTKDFTYLADSIPIPDKNTHVQFYIPYCNNPKI